MSIAMRRAKSRLGAAAIAAVAGAVCAAPAAKATLTVNLLLANGATSLNLTAANNGTAIPVYVYATVTGTNALSTGGQGSGSTAPATSGNFDGLQYLYYNVLNSTTGTAIAGGVSSATLNATLGFNGTGAQPTGAGNNPAVGYGSQVGAVNSSAGVVLGSTTTLTDIAKPRSNSPVFNNYATFGSGGYTSQVGTTVGSNIILGTDGKSVSFLVETLSFTPSAFTAGNTTKLSLNIPSAAATTPYAPANWFEDNTTITAGAQPANTSNSIVSGNYSTGSTITFTDGGSTGPGTKYLYGDLNGDGFVNSADFTILASHYNTAVPTNTLGDLNGDGFVNSADFTILASHYNTPDPAGSTIVVSPTAEIAPGASAVPEPATLGFMGAASLATLLRRKARIA